MKSSRAPVPTEPPRVKWDAPNPREARLWDELKRDGTLCPWCGGMATRVVKTPTGPSHSCWDDHPTEAP